MSHLDSLHVIDAHALDQASTEDTVLPVSATAVAERPPKPLHEIDSMDGYLQNYGRILGRKAVASLAPLHVPGKDELPDFDDLLREPFDCQKHVTAAGIRMLDEVGSGFIVGTMGTGKTLLGMVTVYLHARQSRNNGGYSGRFRCIVLCPDHLISKWDREIKETIPEARVFRFDDWKGIVGLLGKGRNSRWPKPQGAEFYIIGRNQAKWYPDWLATSDPYRGFGGRKVEAALSSRTIIVDRVSVSDGHGKSVLDAGGGAKTASVTARVFSCPRCGTVIRDRKGLPLSGKDIAKNKMNCDGKYLQMIATSETKTQHGKDRLCPIPERYSDTQVGHEVTHGGHRYVVKRCGEPLWWFTSKPYRWAPSRLVHKKLKRLFQYLLIDEVHETKSDSSAQSMAAGKLIASVKHTIALTGTLIGGYADHLFPLLMRINPQTLREEGFEWGKDLPFSERYGRIDRIITTREDVAAPVVGKSVRSMRRARSGNASERKAVRPGVMPTLFGRHMIGSSIFLTLDEMADELPALHEYIGGACPPNLTDPFWMDTACTMEFAQKVEYDRIESVLKSACKDLLIRGSMKLLGTMLWTTLGWPDFCHADWGQDDDLARTLANAEGEWARASLQPPHTVGYWDKPASRRAENWVGVVTPEVLDKSVIYPKEETLIDICLRHRAAGHQIWVYAQMTQKRNVTTRLKHLLEQHGLKVGIMRSGDVGPKEREDWIAEHGREFDVMICHPKLVSTGLDLFSKAPGGHNFNVLVFYQTGYNLFDMRQAARRAWRIGQPKDCYVYYLYYRNTMQHRAMSLMSKKMAAAHALEGEFSEEGLAAMAGEDNLQMALAKSLAEKIDDSDMQRSWVKIKSGEQKKAKRPTSGPIAVAPQVPREAWDRTTDVSQLKLHAPEPEPQRPEIPVDVDMPAIDEVLLAKMFANLAANGMSVQDLAG